LTIRAALLHKYRDHKIVKTLLIVALLAAASARASEIVFSSLYMLNDDYPNIGDIQEPNEFGGILIPFKTGAGQFSLDYLTLEHLTIFDGLGNVRPVNVELYRNNNQRGISPSPTISSALVGSLSFSGNDPRDTRFPGTTIFQRFESDSNLDLTGSSYYFFFVHSDPDTSAAMLFHKPWAPDLTSNLPGWTFTPHFRGDSGPAGEDLVFELAVRVPDGGSSLTMLALSCLGLGLLRIRSEQV
jgi:hypothetical protein